jgi:hypothetical protein
VRNDGDRIEAGHHSSEPKGDLGLESRGPAAGEFAQRQVHLHLRRLVEEAQQPMTDLARLIESIDEDASRALGPTTARRGDDVQDQLVVIVEQIRRHCRGLP